MPKGTRSITLLYHQVSCEFMHSVILRLTIVFFKCVIMATRPLFLSALKQELGKFEWSGRDPQTFSPPLKTLVETGIKSAVKTLQILSGDDSLLGKSGHSLTVPVILQAILTDRQTTNRSISTIRARVCLWSCYTLDYGQRTLPSGNRCRWTGSDGTDTHHIG